jgi:hypothetical protein
VSPAEYMRAGSSTSLPGAVVVVVVIVLEAVAP